MKCHCIKTMESKLAEMARPKAGPDAKATLVNTGFTMTDDMDLRMVLNIPFRVKGSMKGYTSEKGKEVPFVASFCPFCGRSTRRHVEGAYEGLALLSVAV